ncbi:helix-turn-helix transcriptional regulator [Cryobacterium lactosi]|uniref:Helix-turn-helix transcriptional regulator n=1 Tax=Cryobacterium lactosi TaxID=1259202 RepID=A0A4R9BXP8_9MICO|nr:AAA family ATPase [Cryobacterium lactosi]TFD92091.1 helix-turn-helix transcriptional regulator [Cryobacterium lactosi]
MTRTQLLAEIVGLPHGRARQILVTGEAGMGKSTVIGDAAVGFARAGFIVLRAAPSFAERYTSYSMLWDLLAPLDWTSFTSVPAEYRSFLEIALGRRPAAAELPSLATAIAFEGILAEISARTPVAIVIDDAQWADAESRATVERAFRRSASHRVYLVAASRPTADSPSRALDLGFDLGDERVLEGLSVEELDGVIRPGWPSTLTRAQVVSLREHTGGNPLWALELMSRGSIADIGARMLGTVAVPPSLAGTIAERLGGLGAEASEVVSIVALLGHPKLDLLATVLSFAGIPHDAVDAAEAAGFLSLTTETARTRHPLHASAAAARLTPGRRRDLHRFIADAVHDPVVKAQHLHLSRPSGPDELIAAALSEAAVVMRQRGARLRAAHFAAQAVGRTDPASDRYPARVLSQAQQLSSAGDLAACLSALEQLNANRLDLHQYDALLALSTSALASIRGRDPTTAFLRQRELEAVGDPERLAVVQAHMVADDLMTVTERGELSSASFNRLTGVDTPNAVHRALRGTIRSQLDAGGGLNSDLVEDCTRRQGIQIVSGLEDTGLAATGFLAHLTDDVARSRVALNELVAWAKREGKDGIERVFLAHAAHVELTGGNAGEARILLAESGHAAEAARLPASVLPIVGLMLVTDAKHDALRQLIERWQHSDVGTGQFVELIVPALRGFSAFALRDWPAAVDLLRHAAAVADSLQLVEPGSRFRIDLPLIEALVMTGNNDEARDRLAILRSFLETRNRPLSQIGLHRLSSMELAAAGRLEDALTEAGLAVDAAVRADRSDEEARCRLQRARVLTRLRKVTLSRRELQVASERAEESGSAGVREQVEWAVAASRRSRPGTELTAAEQRVLVALVAGQTNKEIAAELFVSIRTVESHVSAILRKTGATSRSKLRIPR